MLSEKERVALDKLWDLFQLVNEVIWEKLMIMKVEGEENIRHALKDWGGLSR